MIKDYKKLSVSKEIRSFNDEIYKLTMKFPQFEMYELGGQLRRAAYSIYLNLAEGNGQLYPQKEKLFLSYSLGSLSEVRACLDLSLDRNYISKEEYDSLEEQMKKYRRILYTMYKSK